MRAVSVHCSGCIRAATPHSARRGATPAPTPPVASVTLHLQRARSSPGSRLPGKTPHQGPAPPRRHPPHRGKPPAPCLRVLGPELSALSALRCGEACASACSRGSKPFAESNNWHIYRSTGCKGARKWPVIEIHREEADGRRAGGAAASAMRRTGAAVRAGRRDAAQERPPPPACALHSQLPMPQGGLPV